MRQWQRVVGAAVVGVESIVGDSVGKRVAAESRILTGFFFNLFLRCDLIVECLG